MNRSGVRSITLIGLALGISAGIIWIVVAANETKNPVDDVFPQAIIRVSPSNLFAGDLRRLEPHLHLSSGCVRIDTDEPKIWFQTRLERWKKGKKDSSPGASRTRIEKAKTIDASVSLAFVPGSDGRNKVRITTAVDAPEAVDTHGMNGVYLSEAPLVEGDSISSDKKLEKTLTVEEGQMVPIWAHLIYIPKVPKPFSGPTESFEKAAEEADFAWVLYIGWTRIEKSEN